MVQAVKVPVIGVGGIVRPVDALEFLIVGATAVQVGTANFVDPAAMITIIDGIEAFCVEEGIRITSYNVCYTKLLRMQNAADDAGLLLAAQRSLTRRLVRSACTAMSMTRMRISSLSAMQNANLSSCT